MLRTGLEIALFGTWSAVFLLMVMPKGKDYRRAFDCPPYVSWAVAVSCAGIEACVFLVLIWFKYLHNLLSRLLIMIMRHYSSFFCVVVGWYFSSLR